MYTNKPKQYSIFPETFAMGKISLECFFGTICILVSVSGLYLPLENDYEIEWE